MIWREGLWYQTEDVGNMTSHMQSSLQILLDSTHHTVLFQQNWPVRQICLKGIDFIIRRHASIFECYMIELVVCDWVPC